MAISRWHELGPFTVFDVETTGMSAVGDRIIELAAIRVESDGCRSVFHSLVHPGCPIPGHIVNLTRIDDAMVAGAPHFARIGRDFLTFAEGTTLVAHNAGFDLSFLQESLNRSGLPLWQGKTMDTIRLLRRTHAGLASYSLQNLRIAFKLADSPGMQAHRAGADVEWTLQLLEIALSALLAQQS
ncbi:MAG: PolC-type DNA polymerase III [Victivallaceae bacterium]